MQQKTDTISPIAAIASRSHLALILALTLGTSVSALAVQLPLEIPDVSKVYVNETSDDPQAVVLSVDGKCEYSRDGITFIPLAAKTVLKEGAVIRTGDDARSDIFFRRIGTTVRVQSGTEVKLEKMTRHTEGDSNVMNTLLDLRTGRIFTVVRSFLPKSTFEIRNAAGRSVVEGGGSKGRYIITADGTHVIAKDSDIPLKLIRETGITIIKPGQTFQAKEGKLFPLEASDEVKSFIDFDELQVMADAIHPPHTSK